MTYLDTVTARLPWTVRTAEWTDPTLVVAGDDWMLSISCAWRVVGPDGSASGWSSPDAEDGVCQSRPSGRSSPRPRRAMCSRR